LDPVILQMAAPLWQRISQHHTWTQIQARCTGTLYQGLDATLPGKATTRVSACKQALGVAAGTSLILHYTSMLLHPDISPGF
jgi:hypothetical protein